MRAASGFHTTAAASTRGLEPLALASKWQLARYSKIPQWLEDPELSRSLSPHGKSSLIILKSNSKDVPRSFYDRMNINDG